MFSILSRKPDPLDKIRTICQEYKRVFDTEVPDVGFTTTLTEIKENKLELLAYTFDQLNGFDIISKTSDKKMKDPKNAFIFVPNLSRCYPIYDTLAIDVKYKGLQNRLRALRYLRWAKSGYFNKMLPFMNGIDIVRPFNNRLAREL